MAPGKTIPAMGQAIGPLAANSQGLLLPQPAYVTVRPIPIRPIPPKMVVHSLAYPLRGGEGRMIGAPTEHHAARPAGLLLATISADQPARRQRLRWSADAWALVRGSQNGPGLAAGAAAYGGSQLGAVLRYDLAPASKLRPQVYVRGAAALSGAVRQPEGAWA